MSRAEHRKIGHLPTPGGAHEAAHGASQSPPKSAERSLRLTPLVSRTWDATLDESPLTGSGLRDLAMPAHLKASPIHTRPTRASSIGQSMHEIVEQDEDEENFDYASGSTQEDSDQDSVASEKAVEHAPPPTSTPARPRSTPHRTSPSQAPSYYEEIDFDKITDPFTDTRRAYMRGSTQTPAPERTIAPPLISRVPAPKRVFPHAPSPYRTSRASLASTHSPDVRAELDQGLLPSIPRAAASEHEVLQSAPMPSSHSASSPHKSIRATLSPYKSPRAAPSPSKSIRAAPSPHKSPRTAPSPSKSIRAAPSPHKSPPRTNTATPRVPTPRLAPAPTPTPRAAPEPMIKRAPIARRSSVAVQSRSNRLLTAELLKWKARYAELEEEMVELQAKLEDMHYSADASEYTELEAEVRALRQGRESDRRAMRQRVRALETHINDVKVEYDARHWRLLTDTPDRIADLDAAPVQLIIQQNRIIQLESEKAAVKRTLEETREQAAFLLGLYKWRAEQARGSASRVTAADTQVMHTHMAEMEHKLAQEVEARRAAERALAEHAGAAAAEALLDGPSRSMESRPTPKPRGRPRKRPEERSSSPLPVPTLEAFGINAEETRDHTTPPHEAPLVPGATPMLHRTGAPTEAVLDAEATPVLGGPSDASPGVRKKKRKLLNAGPGFFRLNEAADTLSPGLDLPTELSPLKLK
ncbi:hypothetical protein MVES_003253 [Malassezia vespertilionis]|uniref:Uncharacterized protein n=1 Tax=Malassezia vespertilionis TaxID=2020962 RepID=A0A2N1J8R5_9BASI|nr:hypothetical protein MVES_003253 [Malassezia vespertilionis]